MSSTNASFNILATNGIVDGFGNTGSVGQVLSRYAGGLVWSSAGLGNSVIPGQSIYFTGNSSNTIINVSSVITYLSSISSVEGYVSSLGVSSINGAAVNPYNPNPAFSSIVVNGVATAIAFQTTGTGAAGFVNTNTVGAQDVNTTNASITNKLTAYGLSTNTISSGTLNVSSINGQPYVPYTAIEGFSSIFTSSLTTSTLQTAPDGYVSTGILNADSIKAHYLTTSSLQTDSVAGYVSTNAVVSFQTLANTMNASTLTTDPLYGIINSPNINTSNISSANGIIIQSPVGINLAAGTNTGITLFPVSTILNNVSSINGVAYVPYTTVEGFSSIITSSIFTSSLSTTNLYTSSILASTIQSYNLAASTISTSEVFTSSILTSTISSLAVYASTGTISSLTSRNLYTSSLQASTITTLNLAANSISSSAIFTSSLTASTISTIAVYSSSLKASTITTQNLGASTISSVNLYTSSILASTISTLVLGANTISSVNLYTSSILASTISTLVLGANTISSVNVYTSSISTNWIDCGNLPTVASGVNNVALMTLAGRATTYPSTVGLWNFYVSTQKVAAPTGKSYMVSAQFSISSLVGTNDSFVAQLFTSTTGAGWAATGFSTVRTNSGIGHIQTNSFLTTGTQGGVSTIYALGISFANTLISGQTNYPIVAANLNVLTNV